MFDRFKIKAFEVVISVLNFSTQGHITPMCSEKTSVHSEVEGISVGSDGEKEVRVHG